MIIATWLAGPAFAASANVSPGDDLAAAAASLGPGDSITFNAGTYELDGTVYWTALGSAEAPVVFRPVEGAEVILKATYGGYVAQISDSEYVEFQGLIFEGTFDGYYNNASGFQVNDSTNITVEDCTFRDVGGTALNISGNTNNITLRHNEIFNTEDGSGIYVGCGDASCWMQDSLIEGNLIHDIGGTGVNLQPGTQNVTVIDNVIYRIRDDGIVMPDTQFGPQNIATSNAIWQTEDDGIYIWGPALVQNNVIFEAGDNGILTRDSYDSLYDVQISHNTIARTGDWAAELDDWFDRDDMVFANNALANPTGYALWWEDPNFDPYTYGYYYGYYGEETTNFLAGNVATGLVLGYDQLLHPEYVIPGGGPTDFQDIDNFDFYPTGSSMLRDTASADGNAYIPISDFNKTNRNGLNPTVGAYEYDGANNPGWVIQEDFKGEGTGNPVTTPAPSGCCGGKDDTTTTEGTTAALFLPLLGLGVFGRRRRRHT